ncbi:MAG: preprotein translocase subunit YajC [Candidatus Ornithomonoglobus sp.]
MNLFGITALAADGATTTDAAATASAGPMGTIVSFAPLIIIIVLFYFLLIRPQRKRDKETKEMLNAMKVGDKVVTIGGICGKVVKIKDNNVFIETGNIGTQDEKSVLKMERDAIKSVEKKQSN